MEIYKINTIEQLIKGNSYVGRGIITGLSEDGKSAVAAYFIMGRSANSRNRIFEEEKGEVYTKPFDASKVEDPSLIIYAAIRGCNKDLVVTNGDQTDTIVEGMKIGMTFSQALKQRCFEPDARRPDRRSFRGPTGRCGARPRAVAPGPGPPPPAARKSLSSTTTPTSTATRTAVPSSH